MPLIIKPTGIKSRPLTTVERLARRFKIDSNGCWLWNGYRNKAGYGQFTVNGVARNAHRVFWELLGNEVDFTKQLDHLCRVRNCVNPKHLEQVTAKQNTLRGLTVPALNNLKTHCANGHELTPDNVYIVKKKYQRVCVTCRRDWVREHRARKELTTTTATDPPKTPEIEGIKTAPTSVNKEKDDE